MGFRLSILVVAALFLISPPAAADQPAPVPAATSLRPTDCRFARAPLVSGEGNSYGFNHQALPRDDQ